MNYFYSLATGALTVLLLGTMGCRAPQNLPMATGESQEIVRDNKIIIYQMLVRLFGNKTTTNKHYGSVIENGTGKFNDITDKALNEIKKLGISHVWYTGVIEHATMTDYSAYGISMDDPDVVKGKAGSPYAIKDYYDVDPDLAVNVNDRMHEFENLISRTHQHQLKVLMDFVPNHVARTYLSNNNPAGTKGFGVADNTSKSFSASNDFYYLPGQSFVVPDGVQAGGKDFKHPLKDSFYNEQPARATGNDVFNAKPSINDWYETIKLNYGVDYQNNRQTYFNPIPPVWTKMRDILIYWANKKVDGFRCDMAEMVPVEFWSWVIPQVKQVNPEIIFIGEAYNPKEYKTYFTTGGFDYLYDKVGLYDGLKRLIRNEENGNVADITYVWSNESKGFSSNMLRFLENHDEERIASDGFAKDPWLAVPAMVLSATLSSGPVMIYFGQEVGEPGRGDEGFGGEDSRTTIFDYWGVPEHQKWMNNGAFDGGQLSANQVKLRKFYETLLNACSNQAAIRSGEFIELSNVDGFSKKQYAFIRHTKDERVLVVANFDRRQTLHTKLSLSASVLKKLGLKDQSYSFEELLGSPALIVDDIGSINITVAPAGVVMYRF